MCEAYILDHPSCAERYGRRTAQEEDYRLHPLEQQRHPSPPESDSGPRAGDCPKYNGANSLYPRNELECDQYQLYQEVRKYQCSSYQPSKRLSMVERHAS
jgi:hypothetical protein